MIKSLKSFDSKLTNRRTGARLKRAKRTGTENVRIFKFVRIHDNTRIALLAAVVDLLVDHHKAIVLAEVRFGLFLIAGTRLTGKTVAAGLDRFR